MATGQTVGKIAWSLMPGGELIEFDDGLAAALEQTTQHLAVSSSPLYEATISYDDVLVRTDLLAKVKGGLHLIEVKSATQVKDYYHSDCAVQLWVLEGAGYPVHDVKVAVVDNSFVYPGGGDYTGLLRLEDVTEKARGLQSQVSVWVNEFKAVLADSMPEMEIGQHCEEPFGCPFWGFCKPLDMPEYPLSCLPRARQPLLDQLESEGYVDIRDIPEGRLENPNHLRVRKVTASGKPELLPEAGAFLRSLPYPLYYLDFETIQFAVPIWAGTRPYEQLPFQWSCHIEHKQGHLEHREFLDLSGQAPMRQLANSLIDACGDTGPIFAYSAGFERGVINKLAERFSGLANPLLAIADRLEDLLPLARNNYYHPAMKGSWSIKTLLPCIVPNLDYNLLNEVHDGGEAQMAYLEAIDPETPGERKNQLRHALLKYCELDTFGLCKIFEYFTNTIT